MEGKGSNQKKSTDIKVLIDRIRKGDSAAIGPIYKYYFQKLLYYGALIIGSEHQEEIEDCIQELFIWLAQNQSKISQIDNFEVYLFQALRRNLQSRQNKKNKQKATFDRYVTRTTALRPTFDLSAEQIQINQEQTASLKNIIHQELSKLPDAQKQAIYLRYFENQSYTDIAAILSISQQAAYNYVFRAIKKLKEQMTNLILLISLFFNSLF